jgi:phytoene dehydrogenase-like protein
MRHMEGLMPILRRILFEVPVDPTTGRVRDLARSLVLAWKHRDAIARANDIAELLTLSAHDFLRRWFESPTVLTAFGCYASGSGGNLSPQTPGSAYVLARPLLRDGGTAAGPGGLVRGGMGSITTALLSAALEARVELHTDAAVARVMVHGGRTTGLVLRTGERVGADTVVANACAQTLFLRLIDSSALSTDFLDRVRRIRTESSCFKINIAADALPEWTAWRTRGLSGHPGSVTLAENLDELEEAFESARRGLIAPRPYLWILAPSAFDETLAPRGQHTLSLFGGHVPYALRGRAWDQAARDELYAVVMRQIDRYAPGFSRSVTQRQVLVPPDLERIFDLPGGHVHHGEMSIDQVFFRRPVAGCGDYRTPIAGLYQCGASTHPGGGVTGVPGYNAARVILTDLGHRA